MSRGSASAVGAKVLSMLAEVWPSPVAHREARLGARAGTEEHSRRRGHDEYLKRVRHGAHAFMPSLVGKDVLEVGFGHGAISCYLASVGARRVVGIDLSEKYQERAYDLKRHIENESGRPLPVDFQLMDASDLQFEDASFDVVVAENVFEHFQDPRPVMFELRRVLRPGGSLVVPIFSSILSKYGLHLKNGIRVPWSNLVFSEATIVEALRQRANRHQNLLDIYPNLPTARTVREVRAYGDLNSITHAEFLSLAEEAGFEVKHFRVLPTPTGRVLRRMGRLSETNRLLDVLSVGASAALVARD